jgi:hypothetical protein
VVEASRKHGPFDTVTLLCPPAFVRDKWWKRHESTARSIRVGHPHAKTARVQCQPLRLFVPRRQQKHSSGKPSPTVTSQGGDGTTWKR